ncbi:hypothetical protein LA080_007791 [Diaporthe eres]|uniref:Uncharacterized protein n=1 Tax=Diaporthe vaccinii TaxID=105482 RepID=A0ABR4E4G9_9PEZI|nr:hypothetical protein LA080_007791 [Diaporthe eres]
MAERTQLPPTRIEIRAEPIVVARPTRPHTSDTRTNLAPPSAPRIPCILNLFFDSESKTAFLRFRFSVATDQQEDLQPMYLLVWPEQITLVAWEDDGARATQDPEISRLCKDPRGTFRLRIELSRAGSVVGPQTWPQSPSTAARLDAQARCDLQWLGEQTQLTIYTARRAMSAAQLQAFCAAASAPSFLKASAVHADITRLYAGQSGKIIENFGLVVGDENNIDENDISTQSGSPPPYDEVTAGPAGPSPGPEQRRSHKPSVKRMRPSSSPEPGSGIVSTNIHDTLRFVQSICEKICDDRQARLRDEIFAELGSVEGRVMHAVEERVNQLRDELIEQIEQLDGGAFAAASEFVDEAVDDKMTSVRVDMEDFIRDEMRSVEDSIWDQLEAGTWEASFLRRQERH